MNRTFGRILRVVLVAVALAGCDGGYPPPGGYDLYSAASAGRATQEAAQAAIYATQQAQQEAYAQATLSAAATQGAAQIEMDLLQARLNATREAMIVQFEQAESTEMAMRDEAALTQTAAAAVVTQAAQAMRQTDDALHASATRTVAALTLDQQIQSENRREVFDMVWNSVVVQLLLILLIIFAIYKTAERVFEWLIEWQKWKRSLFETRSGTVVFTPDADGVYVPRVLSGSEERWKRLDSRSLQSQAQVVSMGRQGLLQLSPPGNAEGITKLAVRLLQDAVMYAGEDSEMVPGWRNLPKWNSERWQRVIAGLEAAGAVRTEERKGTYVSEEYETLGNLLYMIETRQIKVRPALPRGGEEPW